MKLKDDTLGCVCIQIYDINPSLFHYFLPKLYCIVDCFVAMKQLLHGDKAIAASPCSNKPHSIGDA